MKKVIVCIIACFLVVASATASAKEFLCVTNCEEWISLRETPRTSSDRILKIPLGAMVVSLDREIGDFAYVSYAGNHGYVLKRYLSPISTLIPMYVAHCDEYINLRVEPSTRADSLEQIPLGTQVMVAATNDEDQMVYTTYNEPFNVIKKGYVNNDYLSFLPNDISLESVKMTVSKYGDRMESMTIQDKKRLNQISQIIKRAEPGNLGNCPLGAQLVLTLSDGRKLYFMYPTDGCDSLLGQNGTIYSLNENDNKIFRNMFSSLFD